MQTATLNEIVPFVRYFHTVEALSHFYKTPVIPYDHRIFFLRRGSCRIDLGGEEYTVSASDLVFIPSGKPYYLQGGDGELEMVAVNFDFFSDHAEQALPVPPDLQNLFRTEKQLECVTFSDAPELSDYLVLHKQSKLLEIFRHMEEEVAGQRLFFREHNSAFLKWILTHLARTAQCGSDSSGQQLVEEVIALVRECYAQPITNAQIAAKLNYHPNYLNRVMLRYTNCTLHRYLVNYRFEQAMSLLMMTDLSVAEVAARSGFADVSHFSRLFRQKTGQSPGKFRALQTNLIE